MNFVTLNKSGNDWRPHSIGCGPPTSRASSLSPMRRVIQAVTELNGDMPLVVVGGDPAIVAPTVTIDQLEGARIATRHLLDLGTARCTRRTETWVDATARMRGWSDALRAHPAPRGRSVAGDWSARSATRRGRGWPVTVTSPPSSPPTTRRRSG